LRSEKEKMLVGGLYDACDPERLCTIIEVKSLILGQAAKLHRNAAGRGINIGNARITHIMHRNK
jgi:hypothetical protein